MRPDLDREGAAAPPRANGELAFSEPWQRRLFATTMAACEASVIEYDAFRGHLIAQVAARDERGAGDPGAYWAAWQDALEAVVRDVGVIDEVELAGRAEALNDHARPTLP